MSLLQSISKYSNLILLGTSGVLLWLYIHKSTPPAPIVTNPLALDTVKHLKDENGKLYATITQQQLEYSQIKEFSDSLAKALKIKPKYIKGADKIVTRDSIVYSEPIEDSVVVGAINDDGERNPDTLKKVQFHDAWTDIVATLGEDTGRIEFQSRDTLTRVEVAESSLFGSTKYNVFIGNANPHNEIKEGASFQVKEKRTWLTAGPDLQYNPFTGKINLGISVQIPILQLKK